MSAARVFEQLTKLIKDGRVSEKVACKLLEESGVTFVCAGKQGTYSKGMLKVGGGVVTLDPLAITGISFPAPAPVVVPKAFVPQPKAPAPKPAPSGFSARSVSSDEDVSASDPDVVDTDS